MRIKKPKEEPRKPNYFRPTAEALSAQNAEMLAKGFVRIETDPGRYAWRRKENCTYQDGIWQDKMEFILSKLGWKVVSEEIHKLANRLGIKKLNDDIGIFRLFDSPERIKEYMNLKAILLDAAEHEAKMGTRNDKRTNLAPGVWLTEKME